MRMTRPDVPDLPEKDQNRRFNLCYDAYVDDSTGEDVLVIDFYLPKDKSLHKRLFFNGERWFTEYADGSTSVCFLTAKNGSRSTPTALSAENH